MRDEAAVIPNETAVIAKAFTITAAQIELVLTWLAMLEQARVALELENAGHDAFCLTVQKSTDAIAAILRDLPPV
jgi:hypothetical protein